MLWSIIFVVLVILKLFELINWSWWLVFIPIWTPLGLGIIGIIIPRLFTYK